VQYLLASNAACVRCIDEIFGGKNVVIQEIIPPDTGLTESAVSELLRLTQTPDIVYATLFVMHRACCEIVMYTTYPNPCKQLAPYVCAAQGID
jgi:hypothetical protein